MSTQVPSQGDDIADGVARALSNPSFSGASVAEAQRVELMAGSVGLTTGYLELYRMG